MALGWGWWATALGLLLLGVCQVGAEEGILHAAGSNASLGVKQYCVIYDSNWTPFPESLAKAAKFQLKDLTNTTLCNSTDVPPEGIKGKLVVVQRGNCTFVRKAQIAQENFAKALLIASVSRISTPSVNESAMLSFQVALISSDDVQSMRKVFGDHILAALYSPPLPAFDYSILIIFLIAVFTIAFGGYWSGMKEYGSESSSSSDSGPQTHEGNKSKESAAILTPVTVVIFVVVCSAMIVLLYFFYKWLVYMVIGIFSLAAAVSLYNCLAALVKNIPYGKCKFSCVQRSFEVRLLILAVFCIAVAAIWIVFRNEDRWIWVLHDALGIAFCLNFMKTLKMPHFKSCVILLVLLLIYDVFFVFITPYFTKDKKSIMVEVAAGSESVGEKLPVVIRVPRLMTSVATVCGVQFSLLGFGDIIVPGLLIAYCRRFDSQTNTSNIYFILSTTAYAVGMILTFIALILTKMAQPALLYLVPCTLITSCVLAWRRKEMKMFWAGNDYEVLDIPSEPLLRDHESSWYNK